MNIAIFIPSNPDCPLILAQNVTYIFVKTHCSFMLQQVFDTMFLWQQISCLMDVLSIIL